MTEAFATMSSLATAARCRRAPTIWMRCLSCDSNRRDIFARRATGSRKSSPRLELWDREAASELRKAYGRVFLIRSALDREQFPRQSHDELHRRTARWGACNFVTFATTLASALSAIGKSGKIHDCWSMRGSGFRNARQDKRRA